MKGDIQRLVELTSDFLPISTYKGKGITYTSIFEESNIGDYLVGEHKAQQLQSGWENLLRYHDRLPKTIVRKIISGAIQYRRNQRKPITVVELGLVGEILSKLGIDMLAELKEMELDESIPVIKVPPAELVLRMTKYNLHPEIATEPIELFKNGHFNEAVRKAAEKFEVLVQSKSGQTAIGKNLMARVFSLHAPLVPLNSLASDNEKGIQEGFQFMTMGMMLGIRNIFSHGDEDQRSPEECFEMLMFINWLFRQLPK